MYIQKVKLQNFRSFGDEGICFLFNKGINAVIGENNNGKTALIDAIRIAFSCVLYKKDIFFSKTDFHVNAAGERAAFAQIDVYLKDVPQNLIEIWDPLSKQNRMFAGYPCDSSASWSADTFPFCKTYVKKTPFRLL